MGHSHHTHDPPPGDTVPTDSDEVATPRSKRCGYALRAAVTTLVFVTTGGLEYLVNELRLSWNRLRRLSRDEAGYTTTTVIVVALVVVIALAAFVVLWMTVISKAIHTRVECHPGKPCG
jgi:fatty acid desaturase